MLFWKFWGNSNGYFGKDYFKYLVLIVKLVFGNLFSGFCFG